LWPKADLRQIPTLISYLMLNSIFLRRNSRAWFLDDLDPFVGPIPDHKEGVRELFSHRNHGTSWLVSSLVVGDCNNESKTRCEDRKPIPWKFLI
jgi:hypothetical protein